MSLADPSAPRSTPGRIGRWEGVAALAASLAPVLVALTTSAVLAVDYLRDEPVFCAEGGGCAEVRRSAIAGVLGVPLPLVGLAGFLVLGVVSLVPGRMARWAQLGLSAIGGVAGTSLLFAQWRLGAWCIFCATTDLSALVAAVVAAWRLGRLDGPVGRPATIAGALLLLGFAGTPILIGAHKQPHYETPPAIQAEIQRTPPSEVTVVDFVDFECPFCRMTHALLAPLLAAHRDRVRWVRRQVPLRSHPHAQDAARAAWCGEMLGKGDAIADALFSAPVEDLTPQGCEKIAQSLGLPVDSYLACVADPKTDERIDSDRAEFKAAGGYALPTIWIDQRKLVGAQPEEALAGALDAALARH